VYVPAAREPSAAHADRRQHGQAAWRGSRHRASRNRAAAVERGLAFGHTPSARPHSLQLRALQGDLEGRAIPVANRSATVLVHQRCGCVTVCKRYLAVALNLLNLELHGGSCWFWSGTCNKSLE